jgi:hypothetical protein
VVGGGLKGAERAMDLSSLASLGKLAGLGGIAIGAVVLLVRPLIDKAGKAKPEQLALFRLIAIGAFAIGVLGIVAWAIMGIGGGSPHVDVAPCAVGAGRDASGNTVSCGTVPSPHKTTP